MYHLRKLKNLLLLLCVAVTAKAQLSEGNVYNFVNVGNSDKSMVIASNNYVSIATTNTSDYDQLWYVSKNSDGSYSLRNLGSGRYLRSSNAASEKWTMVKEIDANCKFSCTTAGSGHTLRATNTDGNRHYMHYGANNDGNIVGWSTDAAATQWTINVVNISSDDLNANWNELASIDPDAAIVATYQTHLDNLFSDKACTTLKKSFANENAVKSDADYQALPTTLQEMVLKVYKDSWAEENYDVNKSNWAAGYAKKYRVQLYEPYNEPEAAASALGLNAHTNLNNPTGIFANNREALYVMVEGTIKEGSSLYIASYTGNGKPGGYNNGYELKQGLNIIPSFGDGNNYCINYVVHTFDTSNGKGNKAKARKLSDYEDLKIHIEGGYINGYYNKMGDYNQTGNGVLYAPDKNADWEYIEERATQTTVTVLGEYITLQFPLRDEDAYDVDGNKNKGLGSFFNELVSVENVIDEWDYVMLWERLVLGVLDKETTEAEAKKSPYSDKEYVFDYTGDETDGFASGYGDYYNVHGLSYGIPNSYMYGGWDHCGYNVNTMGSIIGEICTNAGSHWGPGHEIGHQHQGLLNLNGLTEVTNNLFSNVVLWYFGETTSRVNGDEGSLSNVLAAYNTEGSDFYTNNIWAQTHLYYKLFLYYHVLGHNPKFYPRLFEMLRHDPMKNGGQIDGATSLLHFYKKCCLAAGEDLTEFFRAYGFFRVMTNRLVGDYSNATYNMTQAQIDAAIAEVKALKYEENIAVLFINDATGETIKSHKGDNLETYGETTICAEVGSYASFTANANPDYTYSVSGNTVTMEGTGGTGFAIFNDKGELISFSDKKTFEISSECAAAIASGKAEIKTIKADNTAVEATDVMDTDNTEAKRTLLGELLDAAKGVTDLADETGKKVGYYRPALLTDLITAYTEAKTVYDNQTSASYSAMYDVLFLAYTEVVDDDFARIGIIEGNAYRLTNKAYPDRSMAVNTSNDQMSGIATADNDAQKWYFEASNSLGRYYLKNKSTGKYPGDTSTGAVLSANKTADTKGKDNGAYDYELRDMGNGIWALVGATGLHCSKSQSYNIVGWGAEADASQWYITAVEVDQNAEALHELQTLIEKTEALVDEMATVQGKGTAVELSAEDITSNATETGHETKYLLDGNAGTFFHTVWASSSVNEPHYLQVDLGEAKSLSEFVWTYTTYTAGWNSNADLPTTVKVTGSTDNQLWYDIATLSDLPTTQNTVYKSATLGNSTQNYRYLRFAVTATSTGGKVKNQYYFGLGEMNLIRMSTLVEAIDDKYTNFISKAEVATVCDQIYAAQQACALGSVSSTDIDDLQAQYDILLGAYENANNVEFNAKKQELLTLISSTNSLINTCGTVKIVEGGKLALSTSQGSGDAYFTQWSYGSSDGAFANLIDGNVSTFYVSDWSNTPAEYPYLQVQLPEGKELGKFTFTFTGRNSGNAPAPTKIVVSGSNNGSTFTEIQTFTKDDTWPVAANDRSITPKTWTSSTITPNTTYKYLRFTVTAAERTSPTNVNNSKGYCHYGISEFGVSRVSETVVTLSGDHGDADEQLLLATYQAVQTAQAACNRATTEQQLQNAINNLAEAKEALSNAMYSSVEFTVNANVAGGGVTFDGGEPCVGGGTLTVPASLTLDELKAKLAAIKLSGYVAQTITINEGVITVIYNKEYTVYINGGEGNGRVTFNGTVYANEGTFNALQGSFTEADLTANDVEGYDKSAVTVDHETGIISVTYTLDKTALEDLIGVTNDLLQACSGFVNSDYVTDELRTNTSAAIAAAIEANSKEELTYAEYTAAVTELQNAYNTLYTAKTSAEAEAAERTELNGQLNTLIVETETLIASCYENDVLKYVNSVFVTEESLEAVRTLIAEADAKCDNKGTTANEYNTSITTLIQAKSDLTAAIENAEAEAALPVDLTIDANTPKLYVIKTKRGGNPVLQYESKSGLFGVTTAVEKEAAQAFYFMAGNKTAEGTLQVYIYPYLADGMVLAANDVEDGHSKALAMGKGTATYEQWVFVEQADGYYNLQPEGKSTYLSNYGGTGNKMGFYKYSPDTDMGSLFKFEPTTVEGSYYYLKLKDYYENQAKVAGSNIQGGEAVGYYPTDKANAYNSAYSKATDVLASATLTDEEYTNAYDVLKAANEALEINMPEEGKYYVIRSAHTGYAANKLMYATGENAIRWDLNKTAVNPEAVWTFTSEGYLENLNTGCAVNTNGGEAKLGTAPKTISIKGIGENGQVLLTPAGGTPLHADWHGHVVSWGTYDVGSASAWRIVEVEDMSLVQFALTIGQYRHASLYLNYATKIPAGVKVFVAHTPNGDTGEIIAEELIDATVLPAKTAVIVQGDAATYNFTYTTGEYNGADETLLENNRLGGSAYLKYQQVEKEGNLCCVFGRSGNEVGLYKNYIEYIDANGSQTRTVGEGESEETESFVGTDNGTHFKIWANKIYFEYNPNAVANASAFRFRFIGSNTTLIDGLLFGSDTVIYNLYGQRIVKVVVPGFYIVNGKKMYVSEKMIQNGK